MLTTSWTSSSAWRAAYWLSSHQRFQCHDLGQAVHAPVLLLPQKTDPLQAVGTALALQPSPLLGLQLRDQVIYGLDVIGVLISVDDKQGFGVGLLEQVGQFGGFVIGVDGEQNGADLGRGKLQGHPVGNVGGPYRHLLAFLDYPGPSVPWPVGPPPGQIHRRSTGSHDPHRSRASRSGYAATVRSRICPRVNDCRWLR
jgi:hypothetical protein